VKVKTIKMKNGQTRRVQVLANGRYKFLKGKAKAKPKTTKRSRPITRKRKVTTTARRRRTPTRGSKRRGKKYTTISILNDIAPLGWGYTTVSGNQLGDVVAQLVSAVQGGNVDIASILMTEIQQTLDNVTKNPVQVGIKLAIGVAAFKWLSKTVGKRQVFKIGKFRLTS
jgi:hypothetical protein